MQHPPVYDPACHRFHQFGMGNALKRRDDRLPIAGIFPDSVIITRERHPFEGCALAVIGSIRAAVFCSCWPASPTAVAR
jgi:hypothetical protein